MVLRVIQNSMKVSHRNTRAFARILITHPDLSFFMVLEESLVFNSEKDAGAVISYLRKKGCKAHKKTITVFFEHETITGTIDRILEWLSGYMVGKDQSPHAGADEKVLEITRKRIEEQKFVLATFFARYKEGDLIYTKRDLLRCTGVLISRAARAISPVIREDLDEPVDEISHSIAYPESPADDTAVALRSLETWNVLWENQLIEERGHDYYLRKKDPCRGLHHSGEYKQLS